MLIGREAECQRIEQLLGDAQHGHSNVLVVRGEAGIGKSALLRYASDRVAGMAIRATRGIESEVEIPFSSLHDLVRADLAVIDELPEPQAVALKGALSLAAPVPGTRFATGAATLALLGGVAEPAGLLVVVDDAQWLDAPTAEALLFAARRLEAEGVLMLIAVRDDDPSTFGPTGLPELRLEGLRREAAHALLARDGEIASEVAEQLFRATGGNPLALIELAATLGADGRAGETPVDGPIPIGRRLEDAFVRRVERLPEPTRRCLLLAAASETQSAATVAAAARELGIDLEVLDPAEAAGLVTLDNERLEFQHPLLRSAIYHATSPSERRQAHRVLAGVLPAREVDRRAWHLARAAAGPDEDVARGLEEAAVEARARAGPGAGARAFRLAAHLTPDADERARRLIEAAHDYQLTGRSNRSGELLDEALTSTADPRLRADAGLLQARVEVWAGQPAQAFEALLAHAALVDGRDPGRAAALLTEAAVLATMRGDYRSEVETAQAARTAATRAGDPHVTAAAEIVLAHGLTNIGDGRRAEEILLSIEPHIEEGDPLAAAPLLQLAGFTWMCLEDHDRAQRYLDRTIGALRTVGALGPLPFLLACRSMLGFRTGRWTSAYSAAWESVGLAEQEGHESESAFYLTCLAGVEAAQGREEECRAHLDEAFRLAERFGVDSVLPWAEAALGQLELGLGHPDEAVVVLERIPDLVERMSIGEPGLVQWAPDLVEAYARAGRPRDTASVLRDLEAQAEATGRRWAHATAARCRGLLAPNDGFEEHFATALDWHRGMTAPFELARTQLCLGERLGLARRRTEARWPLRAALDTFERLGATPWAERAQAELARNGGRHRGHERDGIDRLTPQELQVALIVADGATNKEVAAALFLSTKTIEFHLGNAYRKLHVRSRTELARALAS